MGAGEGAERCSEKTYRFRSVLDRQKRECKVGVEDVGEWGFGGGDREIRSFRLVVTFRVEDENENIRETDFKGRGKQVHHLRVSKRS